MKINKNNYQAYILDYYEGNLSEEQAAMLISFLEKHPGLKEEFDEFEIIKLDNNKENIKFGEKELLKKQPAMKVAYEQISDANYEEFFSAHIDVELSASRAAELESYMEKNPDRAKEFLKWKQIKLKPDLSVFFPNKSILKRHSIGIARKLWYSISAAAAVLILAGLFFMNDLIPDRQVQYVDKTIEEKQPVIDVEEEKIHQAETRPVIADHQPEKPVKKHETPPAGHHDDIKEEIEIRPLNASFLASLPPSRIDFQDEPHNFLVKEQTPLYVAAPKISEDYYYDEYTTMPQLALAEFEKRSGVNITSFVPENLSFWDFAGTGLAAISHITGNTLTLEQGRNEKGKITHLAIGDNFEISRGSTLSQD